MKNSVAVITGASQGIGRSTAIRLGRDFSSVVLVARNGSALNAVADEVRQNGAEPLDHRVGSEPARITRNRKARQLS